MLQTGPPPGRPQASAGWRAPSRPVFALASCVQDRWRECKHTAAGNNAPADECHWFKAGKHRDPVVLRERGAERPTPRRSFSYSTDGKQTRDKAACRRSWEMASPSSKQQSKSGFVSTRGLWVVVFKSLQSQNKVPQTSELISRFISSKLKIKYKLHIGIDQSVSSVSSFSICGAISPVCSLSAARFFLSPLCDCA